MDPSGPVVYREPAFPLVGPPGGKDPPPEFLGYRVAKDGLPTFRYRRDGIEWVRFRIDTGVPGAPPGQAEARIVDRRAVTDSGGHVTERVFILTPMRLAGLEFEAEVNLAQRRHLRFPMLLGRTALAGRFIVDPAASFLQGEEPPLP